MRHLGALNRALSGSAYSAYLQRQIGDMMANDRTSLGQYGLHWAMPLRHSRCRTAARGARRLRREFMSTK